MSSEWACSTPQPRYGATALYPRPHSSSPNQSPCFDLVRSRSGMSLLSRYRGSKGYGACGDAREDSFNCQRTMFFDSLGNTRAPSRRSLPAASPRAPYPLLPCAARKQAHFAAAPYQNQSMSFGLERKNGGADTEPSRLSAAAAWSKPILTTARERGVTPRFREFFRRACRRKNI